MEIHDTVRTFIVSERFPGQVPAGFNDDYDLIDSGTIDSLFMVGLMSFLERQYRIEFGMNDLVPKHFRSVNALSDFVIKKAK